MSVADPVRVVVGIATFRRNRELAQLLPLVAAQAAQLGEVVPGASAHVVVVDNDPEAGARETVTNLALRYCHEPKPGIAAARNRVLDEATDADAVVFIDDDELPEPGWLAHLVQAWLSWNCAGVVGPVQSRPATQMTPWLAGSGMFTRHRQPSGTQVQDAATNNLLLDLRVLRRAGLRLDDAYGLTGGSDSMLSQQLIRSGGDLRWCDEAVVTEIVPESRLSRSWVFRREMRTSNRWTQIQFDLADGRAGRTRLRLEYGARGLWRVLRGAVGVARGKAAGNPRLDARSSVELASGVGIVLALAGRQRVEYRRDPGAPTKG